MKRLFKIITVLVAIALLISVAYIVFFIEPTEKDEDKESPKIDNITENTTGTAGKITSIFVTFSDNVNVTEAVLYYKSASADNWTMKSIISGSADIEIPSALVEDWYYYVTVDDAAGNGPVGDPSADGSVYYTISVSEEEVDFVHTVFVEEGTATWCSNCPTVSGYMHDLYASEDYRFYYISMIDDKNTKAEDRLDEYNIVGYPTVYVDGGYKVVLGSDKSDYKDAIKTAENRDVPEIKVTVTTEYNNNTDELTTNVTIKNNENEPYTGRLRVYLTEIISRWVNPHKASDGKTKPYHYGFIDYIYNSNTQITIDGKSDKTITETQKLSDFIVSNLDPEELMIIAVMFNSEPVKRYSFPDTNEGEFDAYFAEACNATELISGGNLRPVVTLDNPVPGYLHILGNPILETLFKNTILIGKTTIAVTAEDDSAIKKVEFYIDDDLQNTDEEAPYEWTLTKFGLFKELFFHKHKIKVIAYDDTDKTSETEIEVWVRL